MSRLGKRLAASSFVLTLVALNPFAASPAFAHQQRTVGAYQLTVGWETEPTYTGVPNAVELFVHDATGKPVDDLGPNGLTVQVISGTQTSDKLAMTASFDPDTGLGMHGQYLAPIIATRPGDYTFHFTGDINGQKIDERFTSGPTTFNTVVDPAVVQFPDKVPTNAALADSIARLGPRVDASVATATAAHDTASSAKSAAATATTLSIVAIVVAVVLGGAGLAVALRSGRASPQPGS
jgi:hypothetical protein